ncbi:hypothetical protein HXX76_003553 [Chlamydomonas incerta]|uniref:Uncharacterized protein n=1 Tax=Chlamydomonas incerta TaxID=51695 RepID=A0A835TEK9_CHLIN|nr:hypothetical protein HXX76_003553 [Chlamydomonas incerta]|eukprot:KAG2441948.1 hypothetical protein HXX76_003553 [Chlamydomonas incerta]
MGPPTVHDGGYGARRSQPAATAFMGFLTPTVPAAADANEACAASVSSSVPKQQLAASAAVGQAIPKLLKLVRENNGLQRANDQLRSELSRAQAAQLEVQARNKLLQALLDERGHEVARLSNTHLRRTFKLESQLTSCRELIRQLERMQSQLTLEGLQQLQQLEEANRHAALLSAEVASLRERVMEYNDASCPMQHQEQELEQELATFAAEAVQEIEAAAAAVAAEVQEQRLQLRPPFCESTVDPELVELATSFGVPRGFSTRLLQPAAQCSSPFPHMISACTTFIHGIRSVCSGRCLICSSS